MGLQAVDDMPISLEQLLQLAIMLAPDVHVPTIRTRDHKLVRHSHEGYPLHCFRVHMTWTSGLAQGSGHVTAV